LRDYLPLKFARIILPHSVLLQSGSDLVIPDEYVVIQDVVVKDGSLTLVSGCLETKGSLQLGPVLQEQESVQSGPVLMGGMDLNPSCVIAETFMQNSGMVLDVGLGGSNPAMPGQTGFGHYGHLDVKRIHLGGQLEVSFYYGFQPEPGQVFEIISVGQFRSGEFVNAAEGDLVGGSCNVGLRISYQGTDGSDQGGYQGTDGTDVVLIAVEVTTPDPDWPCDAGTDEAEAAPIPTVTPTVTPAPVTAEDNANCRSGPGTVYPIIGFINAGDIATVLGRNEDGTWVFVRLLDGKECWLSGSTLTDDSDFSGADVFPDPPTPFPPTFTLTPTATSKPSTKVPPTPVPPTPVPTNTPIIID
jgi:hypothetical protein